MSKLLISFLASSVLIAVAGCKSNSNSDSMESMKMSSPTTMSTAMSYTCTMHPEVVSDKPGKCPKCGMDLVAKK